MGYKKFRKTVEKGCFVEVEMLTKKGKIEKFVIQLFVKINGNFYPIMRADNTPHEGHSNCHIDRGYLIYDENGEIRIDFQKEEYYNLSNEKMVNKVLKMFSKNYKKYIRRLHNE